MKWIDIRFCLLVAAVLSGLFIFGILRTEDVGATQTSVDAELRVLNRALDVSFRPKFMDYDYSNTIVDRPHCASNTRIARRRGCKYHFAIHWHGQVLYSERGRVGYHGHWLRRTANTYPRRER